MPERVEKRQKGSGRGKMGYKRRWWILTENEEEGKRRCGRGKWLQEGVDVRGK